MRFASKPIQESHEAPLADDGRWEALIEQFSRRHAPAKARHVDGNACYVISVRSPREEADAANKLAEIVGLVTAQGDRIVASEQARLPRIDARTFVGRGLAASISERAFEAGADMIVIDAELSPSQTRNLEDAMGMPICDREAVILNVFLAHAKTRRARVQVEVAHLEYLRPRIRGLGLEMDQQAGGLMRARGPGETASELLARRLDGRLADLRRALAKLDASAAQQRSRRARCNRVALVGYTNAGKTTLMNALTGSALSAADAPFETLDATSRCLSRHGGDIILSDTVGFIRKLPERLLASFESTLAEAAEADLLVIVVDASDVEWPMHIATTTRQLHRLGCGDTPRLYVFNKVDRLANAPLAASEIQRHVGTDVWVATSRHDTKGHDALRARIVTMARPDHVHARVFVAYDDVAAMGLVHARCDVLVADARADGIRFTLNADRRVIADLKRTPRS
jgi:GTPase